VKTGIPLIAMALLYLPLTAQGPTQYPPPAFTIGTFSATDMSRTMNTPSN